MYDIKWIRENLDTFAEGLARRGTPDDVRQSLIAEISQARRGAARRDHQIRAGAGAPQRRLQGNRRGQAGEGRGEGRRADGRGRRAQDRYSATGSGGQATRRKIERPERHSGHHAQHAAGRGADRQGRARQRRISPAWREAQLRVQAEAAFRAGRSAGHDGFRDWRQNYPVRASSCCRRASRAWNARWGSSCSTCIRASMATRRSIRRSWSVMR